MAEPDFSTCESTDQSEPTRFYDVCVKRKSPFVIVRLNGRSASVHWDLGTLPDDIEKKFRIRTDETRTALLSIFEEFKRDGSTILMPKIDGMFENFDRHSAEQAARKICAHFDGERMLVELQGIG